MISSNYWPDVIIRGCSDNEPTKDLEIITLADHVRREAFKHAFMLTSDIDKATDIAQTFINSNPKVKEFIQISDEKITACVNRPYVDDLAVDIVFERLFNIESFSKDHIQYYGHEHSVKTTTQEITLNG